MNDYSEHAVLDLFAGTGVGVALKQLGVKEFGVELMPEAVETRALNGMETIYNDVWDVEKAEGLKFDTLWASPPCQTFSMAGKGAGRKALDNVLTLIETGAWKKGLPELRDHFEDERTALVLSPLHYAWKYRPRHIALEQVPAVLPVWQSMSEQLQLLGYNTWTGILDASNYGVPQTRRRAYLLASKGAALPPINGGSAPNMADSIGWGITNRPSPTITGHVSVTRSPSGTQNVYLTAIESGDFIFKPNNDGKKSTVAKNGIGSKYPPDSVNITVDEAAALQGYPIGFKFKGTKAMQQLQVGNAVPPPVAKAVLESLWNEGI